MYLNKLSMYYTLCDSEKNAESLSKKLIKAQKAVCINVINNIKSFYKENNEIKESKELILIIKSTEKKEKIFDFIIKNHEYKIPFIAKIPNKSVNKEYLEWCKLLNK